MKTVHPARREHARGDVDLRGVSAARTGDETKLYSAPSEAILLFAMMRNGHDQLKLRLSELLTAEDLYLEQHQSLWSIAAGLHADGRPCDAVAVFDAAAQEDLFVGGAQYLGSLMTDPVARSASDESILEAAHRIKQYSLRRSMVTVAGQILTLASTKAEIGGLLDEAQQLLGSVVDAGSADLQTVRPVTLDLVGIQAAGLRAPPRHWFINHWMPEAPTLLAAAGGVGKSLVAQQTATALALGRSFVGEVREPARCLMWACEDDADELLRRQEQIARHFGVGVGETGDRLILQSRCGVEDNLLVAPNFGQLQRTLTYRQLRQQVNDLRVDVLWLDNIGHLFGGDEIHRGQVTSFVNAMWGLVTRRPFAVVLIGHIARSQGSQFAGSAAWENACRSRWYMGRTLPGEKGKGKDDDEVDGACDGNIRYLVRGKVNYAKPGEYVRLEYTDGAFVEREDAQVERELHHRAVAAAAGRRGRRRAVSAAEQPTLARGQVADNEEDW